MHGVQEQDKLPWMKNCDTLCNTFIAYGIGGEYGRILQEITGPIPPEGVPMPVQRRQVLYQRCHAKLNELGIPFPALLEDAPPGEV
jgi:hypothetical protein